MNEMAYIVFVEYFEYKRGKFCWVTLRKKLSVYLLKTLKSVVTFLDDFFGRLHFLLLR